MPQPPAAIPARRDRTGTEARILRAAATVLARDGFTGFGVNAVAAEAGCDKKLISRYFGDLEGVLAAIGGDLGFWLGDDAGPRATTNGGYGARIAALLTRYAASLRRNRLLQSVLAWELVESSPALKRIEETRAMAVGRWMAAARGDLRPPAGVDAPAVNAVLLAAVHYLVLRERTLGQFAGLELDTAEGAARIDAALALLVERAFETREGGR